MELNCPEPSNEAAHKDVQVTSEPAPAIVSSQSVTANVAILELFAVLGGIGWLARNLLKLN